MKRHQVPACTTLMLAGAIASASVADPDLEPDFDQARSTTGAPRLPEGRMNRPCKRWLIAALVASGVCAAHVGAQSSGGPYRIEPSVIAGGGGTLGGGAFELRGTFGQGATTTLTASGYRLYDGFWAPAAGSASIDLIFANGFDP